MQNKRVFVSGGAGVIGTELVNKLHLLGAIVMVGDLVERPKEFPDNVIFRQGDLNYITQQEVNHFDPEIFFHLAATFERSKETYEHWEENFWHNIRLSNHLMSLMRNTNNLKRVVYASSYLIYDKDLYYSQSPPEAPKKLTESTLISPRNLTGMAKLAHEVELSFLSNYLGDKFSSVSARIFRGYGKNSRDVISRWVRDLLNGETINLFNPEGIFDYIYAEDTAEGLIRLANSQFSGAVNLGTGRSRRVKDIIDILSKYFNDFKVNSTQNSPYYEGSEADISLLKANTGWEPARSLEDTIPEIIEFEKNKDLKSKTTQNILITSISRKVPLIHSVIHSAKKINSAIKVVGGDSDNDCLGKYFVDDYWEMPLINNLTKEYVAKYCKDNNIGLIIPTRDGELEFFSKLRDEFLHHGIFVLVSDQETIVQCIDKLKFSTIKGISAISSSETINDIHAETYVVKERFGAGSKSIGINLTKNDALRHAEKLLNPIFQQFIAGEEISIDAYITFEGHLKGLIMRRRDLVIDGESQVTTTFIDDILENKLKKIISKLNLRGPVVLQAIIDGNNTPHLIECNPRFGGASTLSVKAGLDSFYWAMLESNGVNVSNYPFLKLKSSLKQIRHATDYYL